MRPKTLSVFVMVLFAAASIAFLLDKAQAQKPATAAPKAIPKTWDDEVMRSLEVPLADAAFSPKYISASYYYSIPVRPIYKSYTVYGPGKEPPGYLEWLKRQEPEEIKIDFSKLKTEADWVKAGEIIFDSAVAYDGITTASDVRDPSWYKKTGVLLARDGAMPFARYVIREKGKLEAGNLACAFCHTRVMTDGSVIKGAQGNFSFEQAWAFAIRSGRIPPEAIRNIEQSLFYSPSARPDAQLDYLRMEIEEIAARHQALPAGVLARQGTSLTHPSRVPDLIGVKERKYLDSSGLQLHRSIADLMRYAALNQGTDTLSRYGDFIPDGKEFRNLPEPAELNRYSDEQLYALGLYIYSLKAPQNPNRHDAAAARGQEIFKREGCAVCHAPPLYTNNRLTPAEGFKVPADHRTRFDVFAVSVGTDPNLTLKTRRGTGYYKVPSLLGVWYRGPFEHNGSVATLEDWFDPRRLRDDYAPTGFRGYGVKTRAVKGHEFGLDLSAEDRKALIAFLKTL
jgi:hypothetical protein